MLRQGLVVRCQCCARRQTRAHVCRVCVHVHTLSACCPRCVDSCGSDVATSWAAEARKLTRAVSGSSAEALRLVARSTRGPILCVVRWCGGDCCQGAAPHMQC